jgi:hypothetical protein
LTKIVLGYTLGDFFKSSSGHPATHKRSNINLEIAERLLRKDWKDFDGTRAIILFLQEEGWLMGMKSATGQKGMFPANFTRPI